MLITQSGASQRRLVTTCLLLLVASPCPRSLAGDNIVWTGGDGSWFDSGNWDIGVPTVNDNAIVNTGHARFDAPVNVFQTMIGAALLPNTTTKGVANGMAAGMADLTTQGTLFVGAAQTSNVDATGVLTLANGGIDVQQGGLVIGTAGGTGDRTQNRAAGTVEVTGGDIHLQGNLSVGNSGGTGDFTEFTVTGVLSVAGGSIESQGIAQVGWTSGTGSATARSEGRLSIDHGDFKLRKYQNQAWLRIGSTSGTSDFRGETRGVFEISHGDVNVDMLWVGYTSAIAQAMTEGHGEFYAKDGDVVATASIQIGVNAIGPNSVYGLYRHDRGRTTTGYFTLGLEGDLVLGISGSEASDYGQIDAIIADLKGNIEARFLDGFQPKPNDIYTLVSADQIMHDHRLTVTGVDLLRFPNFEVIATDNVLALSFGPVPEPATAGLTGVFAAIAVAARFRRGVRSIV